MGSRHQRRPKDSEPSPFDSVAAAGSTSVSPTSDPSAPQGDGPVVAQGHSAGTSTATAAPFVGMYDAPPPAVVASGQSTGAANPQASHVTFFGGVATNQGPAQEIAQNIDPHAGSFTAYDGTQHTYTANDGTQQSGSNSKGLLDNALDAYAVLSYANMGNQVELVPARDSKGNLVHDANGNLKYDIDYGKTDSPIFGLLPGNYDSAKEMGSDGVNAVLSPEHGTPPGKNDPITIDAHSGGGQPAFFTALELYQKGYTDVNIVGVDMAMTPQERATLEALGVDVSNSTSNVDLGLPLVNVNSPVGALINIAMTGGNPFEIAKYYDNNIERKSGDVFTSNDPAENLDKWHRFDQNPDTLQFLKDQNSRQQDTAPKKANSIPFSSDINWDKKSASIDIGGEKGLGAYVNLSEGQLDLNVFGHHVDIDQGIRNTAQVINQTVHKAQEFGQNANQWVQDKAGTLMHNTGEWVQNTAQTAGNWLQGTAANVGNWLFGGPKTGGSTTGTPGGTSPPATSAPKSGSQSGSPLSASGSMGGKSSGGAKPTATSTPGSGTVVTVPQTSSWAAGTAPRGGVGTTASAGKQADDVGPRAPGIAGAAPRNSVGTMASAGKQADDVVPRVSGSSKSAAPSPPQPTSKTPGKAADDVVQRSSPSSPAPSPSSSKTSAKARDDVAPKSAPTQAKTDRYRFM